MRDACAGTKRDGEPCTAEPTPGSRYCWHHDPDHAEERRRNASRAAAVGNSKVGAEIRSTRLLVRDLVETTVSGHLDPLVRKRLAEVVQLVQSYCRLAELEIAAGERPRAAEVALPEDTAERAKEWAKGDAEREKQREEFVGGSRPWARTRGQRGVDGVDRRPQGPDGAWLFLPLGTL